MKTLRITFKISEHDLEVKKNQAEKKNRSYMRRQNLELYEFTLGANRGSALNARKPTATAFNCNDCNKVVCSI